MSIYDRLNASALRLLDKYGKDVLFTRTTGGTLSSTTLKKTGQTTKTYKAKGLVTDFEKSYSDRHAGNIESNDKMLLIDSQHSPVMGETCPDGRVVGLQPINPAGTLLATWVHLR